MSVTDAGFMDVEYHFMHVICEHHRKPHGIRVFERGLTRSGWSEMLPSSAANRRKQKARRVEVDALPPPPEEFDVDDWINRATPGGDRPSSAVRVSRSGQAYRGTEMPKGMEPIDHETYDLTCPRCRQAGRHATLTRREDRLWPLFDLLMAQGQRTATPELLTKMATRWDQQHGQ